MVSIILKSSFTNLYISNTWFLIFIFVPSYSQLAVLCYGHSWWHSRCSRRMLVQCIGCKSIWQCTSQVRLQSGYNSHPCFPVVSFENNIGLISQERNQSSLRRWVWCPSAWQTTSHCMPWYIMEHPENSTTFLRKCLWSLGVSLCAVAYISKSSRYHTHRRKDKFCLPITFSMQPSNLSIELRKWWTQTLLECICPSTFSAQCWGWVVALLKSWKGYGICKWVVWGRDLQYSIGYKSAPKPNVRGGKHVRERIW